jgi:Protein of unknown function (DUF3995)
VKPLVARSGGSRGAGSLPRGAWAAYAACGWAFLFAAPSFYWAAGGTAGTATLGPGIAAMSRDPWFVAVVWATGVAKVLAGLLALALVRPWGRRRSRWAWLTGAWGGGALLVLHGADFVVQGALALGGFVDVPASVPLAAIRWSTFLWGPWFLLGGLLFCAAAWRTFKGPGEGRRPTTPTGVEARPPEKLTEVRPSVPTPVRHPREGGAPK